ncbi:MAG TPA: hypothetical protein VHV83_05480, partial [Armatimonadota bacterium]|nr:hypothetical protein [Armatimonadota bacterium]
MNNMYHELLSAWCNAMLSLQVRDINVPGIYGGIMCPACSRIHGRSADAVYPFLYMAHATSEERYLRAAIDLLAWSDHSSLPDGSWINEPTGNEWKGITVFGALALAEALRHHGEVLDESTRTRWEERLHRAAEFLDGFMTIHTGNINYPVSASAALAVAGEYFSESRYTDHARELAHQVLAYFSQDNKMLFGEGHPGDGITPRGCRAIDLGYNVEESLPALALYGRTVGDEEVLTMVTDSLRSHLEFMLPDGAWDNSWGARNYKWTYWGSRTSDGCHMACALLAGRDPHFAEAARRNTELLAACTHDGLLYGGPHYQEHGELPCVHHTFCHAKALAAALDYRMPESDASVALPREKAVGV